MSNNNLKKDFEFRTVYKRGKSFSNSLLVLYVYRNYRNYGFNRIGISVSKKVGKSVIRSRVKRLIKENYRLKQMHLKNGYDFVIIARVQSNSKNYNEIEKAFVNLFKKAGIYYDEKNINCND